MLWNNNKKVILTVLVKMSLQINSFDAIVDKKTAEKQHGMLFSWKNVVNNFMYRVTTWDTTCAGLISLFFIFSNRKENVQFVWRLGEGLCRVAWLAPTRLASRTWCGSGNTSTAAAVEHHSTTPSFKIWCGGDSSSTLMRGWSSRKWVPEKLFSCYLYLMPWTWTVRWIYIYMSFAF